MEPRSEFFGCQFLMGLVARFPGTEHRKKRGWSRERICSAVHGARELFGVCICGIRWQENNLESVRCSGARVEDVCLGLVTLIGNSKYRPVKKGVKGAGLSGA